MQSLPIWPILCVASSTLLLPCSYRLREIPLLSPRFQRADVAEPLITIPLASLKTHDNKMRLLPTTPEIPLDQMLECLSDSVPKYAILSHTWGDDEITIGELSAPSILTAAKKGFEKIRRTCDLARARDNLEYAWVDTCCIDKTSSAELTEAINSMFAWYANAEVCYAYLSDLEPGTHNDMSTQLPRCKWFTRGWTLQELIAPKHVIFLDREWNERGTKQSLCHLLRAITGIPVDLLERRTTLEQYAVARRMSWAATRQTTRIEDMAYCLLGMFGVHLSLIYGEGSKAFIRLQEAIVLSSVDLSIFTWVENRPHAASRVLAPVLAEEPIQFRDCGSIEVTLEDSIYGNMVINTRGILVEGSLVKIPKPDKEEGDAYKCILDPICSDNGISIGIPLRKIGGGRYVRYMPEMRILLEENRLRISYWRGTRMPVESLTLSVKIPDHFPFPGPNAIIGNRHSALRLEWLNEDPEYTLTTRHFLLLPRSHWDAHDDIFISTVSFSHSWCAGFVQGVLTRRKDGALIPVRFFVSCHGWNLRLHKVVVASLHDMEPATTVLFESQLDRIRFESNSQAERLILSTFSGKLPPAVSTTKTPLREGKALIETTAAGPDSPSSVLAAMTVKNHAKIIQGQEKVTVEVVARVCEERRPDLCSLPMWRLEIGCKVLSPSELQVVEEPTTGIQAPFAIHQCPISSPCHSCSSGGLKMRMVRGFNVMTLETNGGVEPTQAEQEYVDIFQVSRQARQPPVIP